jgi:carbon-monoxide dehydrogenase medium subunit
VRVRQTASVGGNLAHADYRLDPPPPLLVLGAEVSVFGPSGSRVTAIKDFFRGLYETALAPGEILVSVKIPFMPAGSRAVYLRYSSLSANDWPCLGLAALLAAENGRVKELRLALGGVAATPVLVHGLEFVTARELDNRAVGEIVSTVDEQISPSSDFRGSEWYKRRMVQVFIKRALAQLNGQAAA